MPGRKSLGAEDEQRIRNSGFRSGLSRRRVLRGRPMPLRNRLLLVRQSGGEASSGNIHQIRQAEMQTARLVFLFCGVTYLPTYLPTYSRLNENNVGESLKKLVLRHVD